MRRFFLLAGTAATALILHAPAVAQEASGTAPPPAPDAGYHDAQGSDIVVTGVLPRDRRDILSGVSVVEGAALVQALRPTIGETLERQPGVSSTSFGPNASRPVLRGLQGDRVRVLTDGIGSIDVSNTSVDHAVAIDPLLAERVEVLRGPAALLYGSAAIGGVVNVIDRRIPRAIPDEPVHAQAIATYGSAANERSVAGTVDVPVGHQFVVHVDGSDLKSDDLAIGGHVLSRTARAEALASAALPAGDAEEGEEPIDFAANAALKGKLPNSQSRTWTTGVGAALITDGGTLGVSYGHYDSLYGVPVRYATAPGEEQEAPRLDLSQDRFDLRAEVKTGGTILQQIRFRAGYATYRHYELEEDGAIGTAFYNKGLEGRLELVQATHGAWAGASGIQYLARDFDVVGEEAFLPKNTTSAIGLFTLQQFDLGRVKLEGGLRYEHTGLETSPLGQPQFFAGTRRFGTVSGSAGASLAIAGAWRIGLNLSRSERAPSAEELFANGPHAGTQAFEIGNPDLRPERSWGLEAVLRGHGPGYTFEGSVYGTRFANYIYDERTGAEEDGLPVFQGGQGRARYLGFEAQGTLTLARIGPVEVQADGLADYVRATILDVGPAPRIPPLRLLGGVGATSNRLDGHLEVEWSAKQARNPINETDTDGFTLVNATLDFRPWGKQRPLSFALSANNIFDVDARRSASFLEDFAPLPGRDVRVTARVSL